MSSLVDKATSNNTRGIITRDNHYVPRLYLKHFATSSGAIYRYRTLVSRPVVAEWKKTSVSGVGYQSNLYTRAIGDHDSDEIEQWLNRDFETPAALSIQKVINNQRLEKDDYRLLVRFLAAQIVRTPAFLIENLPRMREFAANQLKTLSETVAARLQRNRTSDDNERWVNSEYYPLRVTTEPSDNGKILVKTESVVGRAMWIFAMRHLLTNTLDRLDDHKWVILSAEHGLPWFTTDDPVVRLNYRSECDYDFKGGWGVANTNIFIPLSPRHLLFTQVGSKSPFQRGDCLPRHQAVFLRRVIAEHAHRYIFSPCKDATIPDYRPRHVDADAVKDEQDQWKKWHEEQSRLERELFARTPSATIDSA